jgi:release factor glutamine methyltransferase
VSELPTSIEDALQRARRLGVDRLDAQLLVGAVLQQPRSWLLAHDRDPLPTGAAARIHALLQRRAAGEPTAYLLGHKEFFGLTLAVNPDVLVPRPDTETLVHWALDVLAQLSSHTAAPRVLDLGTGSGAIALAVAHTHPQAQVTAVDASEGALRTARLNGERLGLTVAWRLGSWFEPVAGERFNLILSNPPYIAEHDPHLPDLRFEPRSALTAGADGLDDLRAIIQQAPAHLNPGGWLLLEHGWDQADAVAQLLRDRGFLGVDHRHDLGGHVRCTGAQWQGAGGIVVGAGQPSGNP